MLTEAKEILVAEGAHAEGEFIPCLYHLKPNTNNTPIN